MRLKDVVVINSSTLPENTSNSYMFKYIDISSISSDGDISLGEYYTFGDAPSRARRIIKQGDILVSTVRTYLRAIAPINFDVKDTIASTGFAVCTPKKNLNTKYLAYTIRNNSVIDEICKESTGVSYPAITASRLSSINIPYTDIEEQQAIAEYLDKKTAEIDEQISLLDQKQKAYAKLKQSLISEVVTRGLNKNINLKDSGIEWIGKIPTHWEVKRLKDIAFLYSGLTGKAGDDFSHELEPGTKPYIPFTNILNNKEVNPKNLSYVRINQDEQQNKVRKNDLIFLMSSEDYESIAKSAVVSEEIGEVYLNSFCRGLRPTFKLIDSKFLNYLLSANTCRDALRFEARGFTRINIKIDKIASHFIFYPPIEEQQAIADYLDKKTAEIDENIALINQKIKAYKRLKQSLIDEVVTGKRKI